MPNNFRITGDYYVSKEGSDSNNGTSPETPVLTLQAGLNLIAATGKTLVIGSGVYRENISKSLYALTSLIGDGKVIIESVSGNDDITFNSLTTTVTLYLTNIEFRNIRNIYLNPYDNSSKVFYASFTDCIIKCNLTSIYNSLTGIYLFGGQNSNYYVPTYYFTKCLLINSIVGAYTLAFNTSFDSCILINTKAIGSYYYVVNYGYSAASNYGVGIFKNSYLDSNSSIQLLSQISSTDAGQAYNTTGVLIINTVFTTNFVNNNIQGKIIYTWNGLVSGAGTRAAPITYAQSLIDYPTYNLYSINADPKFNDALNLNYTLQASSPHIKAANDGVSNIGGTEYAVYKSAGSTEFTTGATVSGLTLRGNNSYTITSSPTPGTIETAPIQVQSYPATRPLTKLEWVGSLEFNKSITAGTQGNTNVPDWDTYTTGAGANPDRLTVKMRYSTQSAQPTTSSEWDNGGYWTAGNYELFEINAKPKIDVNGKGNGNPDYVESGGIGDLVPTWIQLSIKLIDTYNP